jgi:RNA polymerase sigma-70 factor, ECF subfamily
VQDSEDRRVSDGGMERLDAPVVTEVVPAADVRRVRPSVESVVVGAFDEHAGRLKSFALRAVRDADVADDLVQEAFLRLVGEVRSGAMPDDPQAWLFRVCGNLIVSRGRRMAVAARMRSFLVDRRQTVSPEEHAVRSDESARITGALAGLPADARVALLMAAAGYSSAEIGRAIGRTENATLSYVCRARIRLRDRLAVAEEERS